MPPMATDTGVAVDRRSAHRALARILLGVFLLGIVANVVIAVLDASLTGRRVFSEGPLSDLGFVLAFGTFPIIGYVLATRRPDNSLGWLMLAMGVVMGLPNLAYGTYAIHGGPGGRDLGRILIAIDEPTWVPIVVIPATFLILLFPDGHLPSSRWRWFARVIGVGYALIFLAILLGPGPFENSPIPNLQNPLGIEWLRPILNGALVLLILIPIGAIGSLVSLMLRFRRSSDIERLQLRWLLTAASIVAVLYSAVLLLSISVPTWRGPENPAWLTVFQNVAILSFALIPIAIGVAVLRYRLFEIDVVVNRALLFSALALFVTVVYVAIVVGAGAIVGSRASPVLSAVAAAIVALAFQPVRRRAQHVADRVVYGKRATPYEVLSEFSDRLGTVYANEDLLPRMARALAGGAGAARTDVWIRVGEELRPAATWPEEAPPAVDAVSVDEAEASSARFLRVPVRHQGELLGALSIEKRPGDNIQPTEEKLVRDLAAQAGLVMRNAALTEQLLEHIEQLRASRQRLVHAQDEERRRIERNLHDGAQQQLVALSVKIRLIEGLIQRDVAKARELLAGLTADAGDAIETLRDLARGIYPPLLADRGLVAALEAQVRKAAIPAEVVADRIARYPQEVEATVYFCALEALNNAAKHSGASRARVRLAHEDGVIAFAITDDGAGFDAAEKRDGTGLRGMTDRVDAVGGTLDIRSGPGVGTTVSGRVPI
jgi:signal transduction histidine kinase